MPKFLKSKIAAAAPACRKFLRVGSRRRKDVDSGDDSAGPENGLGQFCKCDTSTYYNASKGEVCPHCGLSSDPKDAGDGDGGDDGDKSVGRAAFFKCEGIKIAGRIKSMANGYAVLNLAIPDRTGALCVSEAEVSVKFSELELSDAVISSKRVRCFEAGASLALAADAKSTPIFQTDESGKSTGIIVDYQNVIVEGHASTFGSPQERDRGGDYVMPGAWNKTLGEFKKNPVMLTNHDNSTEAIAGSWTKVGVDGTGLAVRGAVTNAPGMKDLRFKLVEGHLKGLSIGGVWYYSADDQGGIEEADLYEISLVAVPMNADTLCSSRSLGQADCLKAFARFYAKKLSFKTLSPP